MAILVSLYSEVQVYCISKIIRVSNVTGSGKIDLIEGATPFLYARRLMSVFPT